jgi:hypothetical protein
MRELPSNGDRRVPGPVRDGPTHVRGTFGHARALAGDAHPPPGRGTRTAPNLSIDEIRRVHHELRAVLKDTDPFWPWWLLRAHAAGLPEPLCYGSHMTLTLKARVHGGRLVLDEPVDLPEGSELELMPLEDVDTLDDEDRAKLHASLDRAAEQFRQGPGIPASEALARLRAIGA